MWVFYTIIYAVIIGIFSVFRKKAVENTNIFFSLALSSTFGFLLICWNYSEAVALNWQYILLILLKSFIVAFAWYFEVLSFKKYYLSSLQPLSAIEVVLSFFVSMFVFSEAVAWWQFIGVFVVVLGLFLLNKNDVKDDQKNNISKKYRYQCIMYFVLACIFYASSSLVDRYVMFTATSNQNQYWFMLFVSGFLWLFLLIECLAKKKVLVHKNDFNNTFIYLIGVMLIIADQFYFKALADPSSLLSVISIIRQLSTVVAVIFGAFYFKEPNLKNKLVYLAIIMCGIIIILI